MAVGKERTINSVLWFSGVSGITMWYMLFLFPFAQYKMLEFESFTVLIQNEQVQGAVQQTLKNTLPL